jgi:cytochrome P450
LIDAVIARGTGRLEVVADLARPLPSRVICRILGLAESYADRIHAWMDEIDLVSSTTSTLPSQPDMAEFPSAADRRAARPAGLRAARRAHFRAGCRVSGGRPLSDRDLIGYCAMLLSARVDTTATSISNALVFLTDCGHWTHLRVDPSLIPDAIEETLRWYPASPGVRRYVLAE